MSCTLRDLQTALRVKIQELRERDELIDELEQDINKKEGVINKLQGELDTYKNILKKANLMPKTSMVMSEKKKYKERTKRTAISAECTGNAPIQLNNIKKVSKTQQ